MSKMAMAISRTLSAYSPSLPFFSKLSSSSKFFLPLHPTIRHSSPTRRRIVPHITPVPKPTVLVAEDLGEDELALLKGFANVHCSYNLSHEELCARISGYDGLIVCGDTMVSREVFESSDRRLKVVGRAGAPIDNVDIAAATKHGCLVVSVPTSDTVAAAELAIALLMATARNVAQADASVKAGKWEREKYEGVSLARKTLAVIGFGKVGSEVARLAKGLRMNVIAHDPYSDWALTMGVDLVGFGEAIANADIISLHIPLTPSTSKILNDNAFAKMKKGVLIVNVGCGGVIDEEALLKALDDGTVAQI